MELTNEFEVPVPIDEAWAVLTDLERIAPAMPGAELQEVEGDEYRGVVKVKVGPITASYRGAARFEELDTEHRRAVLKADGRETRGQGNASATITASLSPSGDGTKVTVVSEIAITGKVAQFGRGVLADVSGKLLDQFVRNLETTVLTPGAKAPAAGEADRGANEATAKGTATAADPPKAPLTRAAKNAAARAAKEATAAAASEDSEAAPIGAAAETTGSEGAAAEKAGAGDGAPADAPGVVSPPDGSSAADSASAGDGASSAEKTSAGDGRSATDNGSAAGAGSTGLAGGGGPEADEAAGSAPAEEPKGAGIRQIHSAPAEPVDLVGVAGSSIAKRMVPFASVAGVLVLIRIIIYAMKRRKR